MPSKFDPTTPAKWPVLSVMQPHAIHLVTALKRYENRTWQTPYRGPMWIHAGSKRDARAETAILADLPVGAVIGAVELRAVRWAVPRDPLEFDSLAGPADWETHPLYQLEDPVPCKGKLLLWLLPPLVARRCIRQLPGRR